MKHIFLLISLLTIAIPSFSDNTFFYRICLKDKGISPYSTEEAEMFLSEKSIERRTRQQLEIDLHDLPIDPAYLSQIAQTGAEIRTLSKWAETVTVHVADTTQVLPLIRNLTFVDTLYCVWKGDLTQYAPSNSDSEPVFSKKSVEKQSNLDYGQGLTQISMCNGHLLHSEGFRGEGVEIAVIDGGFNNADINPFFDQTKILEVKSFNHETNDPFRGNDHGANVLSLMLADSAGTFIGTAPDANYRLLRSEVDKGEFPVEEDYYIAALEYADSIGSDIVTTSLGYNTFDMPEANHTHEQLDGATVPISRAASLAASRGILLFTAAGNERSTSWQKIMFPADATDVITVGSVTAAEEISYFSSVGYTADGRIKPDLMAMGTASVIVNSNGANTTGNGTSYATPLMAGLGACLRGAFPDIPAADLVNKICESGDRYQSPDSLYGYGIPDFYQVYTLLKNETSIPDFNSDGISMEIRGNMLIINNINNNQRNADILRIYSCVGTVISETRNPKSYIDISHIPQGIYIANIIADGKNYAKKFIKK